MNNLLIFFALPIATIILSAVLEKALNCPLAVASVTFAIYLIVTFSAFDTNFLIATIVYTILSLITALTVRFIRNLLHDSNNEIDTSMVSTLNNTNANINVNNNSCMCNCRRRF